MISDNTMNQCMQSYFQIEPAKSKQLRSQCGIFLKSNFQ